MKRILVLALALILTVSSLVVPSYAAESPVVIDNWLESVEYVFNGLVKNSPSEWVHDSSEVVVEFDINCNFNAVDAFMNFECSSKPSSVYILDGSNKFYSSVIGSDGIWQAVWKDINYTPAGRKKIVFTFSSPYSGWLFINSFYGIADNTISFSNVSYFANAIMYDNGDGGTAVPSEDDFRWPVSVSASNSSSLPVVVDYDGPTGSDFYSIDYGEVFLKVPLDQGFQYLESVSFLLYVSEDLISCGARLEDSSGVVYDGLPIFAEYCGETQMLFETEENFHRLKAYVVTVDVAGYDLSGLTLTLQSNISRSFGSFIYQYDYGFYYQCSSIVGSYNVDVMPWYSIFSIWLSRQYDSIKLSIAGVSSSISSFQNACISVLNDVLETLVGFRSVVITWFEQLNGSVVSFRNDVVSWFGQVITSVNTFKDSVLGSLEVLNGTIWYHLSEILNILGSSGDNQQFGDDVGQQGDKLDDLEEVMDSVTKPALDSIDTNLSGIVSDADLTNVAQVYTMVIGDSFLPQIMTMVVVMAMMSFVLFGKR